MLLDLQHFEVYLGGSDGPILVYTDHNSLVFLNRMSNTNQRLMCWSLIVQEYHLFLLSTFFIFFFRTQHHNITSTQNKQNKTTDTYSMF